MRYSFLKLKHINSLKYKLTDLYHFEEQFSIVF